jgi:hypothetical protein
MPRIPVFDRMGGMALPRWWLGETDPLLATPDSAILCFDKEEPKLAQVDGCVERQKGEFRRRWAFFRRLAAAARR